MSISALLISFCCCDTYDSVVGEYDISSISQLRSFGSEWGSNPIMSDIIIDGYVTANDMYGEFYKKIIIEDESGAVEVLCDVDRCYQLFPFGSLIRINCNGLWIAPTNSKLQLGARPQSEYSIDRIPQNQLFQYIRVVDAVEPIAHEIVIDELTERYISRYVVVKGLAFMDCETNSKLCCKDPDTGEYIDTWHVLQDSDGNQIRLFVDENIKYKEFLIYPQPYDIYAIVDRFDDELYLTITSFGIEPSRSFID